jgi:hypothetical protein
MKKIDIRRVVSDPPIKRAAQYLNIGAELRTRRKKPQPKTILPKELRRESVTTNVLAPVLERMHGIETIDPVVQTGLKWTGRRISTRSGEIDDLVLTRYARKSIANQALDDAQDDSVSDTAVRQLAIGMLDNDPVARCCAAYGYWQATGSESAVSVLKSAIASDDEDERTVAAHALAKVDIKKVRNLQGSAADDKANTPAQPTRPSMTAIIHGTFAKDANWYRPGGGFHTYIKKNVYPDVYSGKDFYFWSGRYSLSDNGLSRIWSKAADKLVSWINAHPAQKLRLIAHSHGNNVVNIATQKIQACSLIQLSPPVRSWNLPNMANVTSDRIFNIHSRIDLVVMIDGGAQNYKRTAVASSERIRKIARFGHADSHKGRKWKRKKVPKLVTSVCQ